MARITKDSISYDGGDVIVSMLGIADLYAERIEYKTTQEHQLNYGMGREPRSWSKGKKEFSCTLEIMMEDVVAIQTANPNKSLIDISPFNIVVSFLPSNISITPMVDTLLVKFQDSGRAIGQEKGLKQSFEMFVLNIDENILN